MKKRVNLKCEGSKAAVGVRFNNFFNNDIACPYCGERQKLGEVNKDSVTVLDDHFVPNDVTVYRKKLEREERKGNDGKR